MDSAFFCQCTTIIAVHVVEQNLSILHVHVLAMTRLPYPIVYYIAGFLRSNKNVQE